MTQHEKIFMAKKNANLTNLDGKLQKLKLVAEVGDVTAIKKMLKDIVPTYTGI